MEKISYPSVNGSSAAAGDPLVPAEGKGTAVIEAVGLCRTFGRNHALRDVSFSLREGEIVGLIGPNGAGKSTTMNILCGYLAPTSGRVSVCGIDLMEDPAEARRHIGYMPEIPPLYTDMTVEEQVRFACRMRGMKKGPQLDERVRELCEKTHAWDMRKRLIRSLSKGYRQRAALAQLLAGDPQILILDEPTVGLDPRQIREFRDLFLELGKNHTVIFSSHILSEINSICDRILIFEKGEILADGKPEELCREDEAILKVRICGDPLLSEKLRTLAADTGSGISREDGLSLEDGRMTAQFRISCADAENLRREINTLCRREGWDLMELSEQKPSLEDIYLKITEKRSSGRE